MKVLIQPSAAAAIAILLTMGSSTQLFAMGCAQTIEGSGRVGNTRTGERTATTLAVSNWQSNVRRDLGRECSTDWSRARNKSVTCDAGMGHIACNAAGEPATR